MLKKLVRRRHSITLRHPGLGHRPPRRKFFFEKFSRRSSFATDLFGRQVVRARVYRHPFLNYIQRGLDSVGLSVSGNRYVSEFAPTPRSLVHYQPLQHLRYPPYPTPLESVMPRASRAMVYGRSRYRDQRELRKGRRQPYGGTYLNRRQRGFQRSVGYYGRYYPSVSGRRSEKKFHDVSADTVGAAIGATLEVLNLTVIPQGTKQNERIGRVVYIEKIHFSGTIEHLSSVLLSTSGSAVRLMLVQDKQTNGVQFTGADLFEVNTYYGVNKLSNKDRFKVLWQTKVPLVARSGGGDSGGGQLVGEDFIVVEFFKKFKSAIKIEYSTGTTGAITEVRSNNVYFCMVSTTSALDQLKGVVRLRFTD